MVKAKGEETLYAVVADYLKRNGYTVRVDSPKGSGIKIDLLKGWTIDVVGVKPVGRRKDVVAVEVKNHVSPMSVLQALSQAEIYQNACTKVYIGFPTREWDKEENVHAVKEVKELCQARGIGILKIRSLGLRDPCIEELPPISSLRLDMYQGILEQFIEKVEKFEGFDVEDFQRTLEDDPSYHTIVRRKLRMLLDDVFENLPRHLQSKLKYRDIGKSGFWGFLSEEKNKVQCTHFNVTIHGDELRTGAIAEGKKPVAKLMKKINREKKKFLTIVNDIEGSRLVVWKRVPTRVPRLFEEEYVCTFQSEYMNMLSVDFIIKTLKSLKLAGLRLYFPYSCEEEIVHSSKLTKEVVEDIGFLEPFYDFARR